MYQQADSKPFELDTDSHQLRLGRSLQEVRHVEHAGMPYAHLDPTVSHKARPCSRSPRKASATYILLIDLPLLGISQLGEPLQPSFSFFIALILLLLKLGLFPVLDVRSALRSSIVR